MNATGSIPLPEMPVVVVSGLPRSGTSMMMRMLEAGGLPALTDGFRKPDPDNPYGYYEFEPVRNLPNDASWVPAVTGKAVKIVYSLLCHLPTATRYKVIFMRRIIEEVVASQDEMRRRKGVTVSPEVSKRFIGHIDRRLRATEAWLSQQKNFEVLYIDYNRTLGDAESTSLRVKGFLDLDLDVARMQSVVTQSLYRQRAAS